MDLRSSRTTGYFVLEQFLPYLVDTAAPVLAMCIVDRASSIRSDRVLNVALLKITLLHLTEIERGR
jgi:hypothetical protein